MQADSLDENEEVEEVQSTKPIILLCSKEKIEAMISSLNKLCNSYDSAENSRKEPAQRIADAKKEWKKGRELFTSKENYLSNAEWNELFVKLEAACEKAAINMKRVIKARKLPPEEFDA